MLGLFATLAGLARRGERLLLLAFIGAVVYFGVVLALFGKQWLAALSRSKGSIRIRAAIRNQIRAALTTEP